MKVLFVDACVRQQSRTRMLCQRYIAQHYVRGDKLTKLVLMDQKLCPLSEESLISRETDIAKRDYSSEEYRNAKEFAQADEILIGAPYWDFSFPSILKVYFEHICVNGITFGYGADGKPKALCKAKRLVYLTTAGGYLAEMNSVNLYIKELCALFGIADVKFFSAEGLDIEENDAEKILDESTLSFE